MSFITSASRRDPSAGRKFPAFFGTPATSRTWFEPTPLRALFAQMLARRRRMATEEAEDRTGYDPNMMGLS